MPPSASLSILNQHFSHIWCHKSLSLYINWYHPYFHQYHQHHFSPNLHQHLHQHQLDHNDHQHQRDVAGEVPNLFPADEKAEILERVQNTAREEGRWHIKENFKRIIQKVWEEVSRKGRLHVWLFLYLFPTCWNLPVTSPVSAVTNGKLIMIIAVLEKIFKSQYIGISLLCLVSPLMAIINIIIRHPEIIND